MFWHHIKNLFLLIFLFNVLFTCSCRSPNSIIWSSTSFSIDYFFFFTFLKKICFLLESILLSINNLFLCIYICIWKNSLFLGKRFLVYIQTRFLCLQCKYSTFVPFSRSVCTKINIIFISTWFSTEAALKRLFLQLLLLKNREIFWFKYVFSPIKRVATIGRWIFQEVWQMKLQLDNTKLCRIREITLHQSSYRKRIKSEKIENIC